MRLRFSVILLLALWIPGVQAVEHVNVLGLFAGKAVLRIDGQRRVLAEGETSPEGVKLIKATSEQAVLEYDGVRRTKSLGSDVSTRFKQPDYDTVRIHRDARGMYRTVGSINGQVVDFLVDTGATLVAMSAEHARQLGIDYQQGGTGYATTASGVARAYRITLDSVRVGEIRLTNVPSAVLEGGYPRQILLGMSFLERLEIENKDETIVLKQKY